MDGSTTGGGFGMNSGNAAGGTSSTTRPVSASASTSGPAFGATSAAASAPFAPHRPDFSPFASLYTPAPPSRFTGSSSISAPNPATSPASKPASLGESAPQFSSISRPPTRRDGSNTPPN